MRNIEEYNKLTEGEQSLVKWQFKEHGGFWTAVWDAISKADGGNLNRMALAFPSHVKAYRNYTSVPGWWEELIARVGR